MGAQIDEDTKAIISDAACLRALRSTFAQDKAAAAASFLVLAASWEPSAYLQFLGEMQEAACFDIARKAASITSDEAQRQRILNAIDVLKTLLSGPHKVGFDA